MLNRRSSNDLCGDILMFFMHGKSPPPLPPPPLVSNNFINPLVCRRSSSGSRRVSPMSYVGIFQVQSKFMMMLSKIYAYGVLRFAFFLGSD